MIVQFPDLTEFPCSSELARVNSVQTEFAFYLGALVDESYNGIKDATRFGFTAISRMNNWWPTHNGENRALTLYWKRCHDRSGGPLEVVVMRMQWPRSRDFKRDFKSITKHLAASGCGFKIGEPPLKAELFHRFFTLMRMPVKVSPIRVKWLTAHNYRLIDTGKLASYWVNGWDPKTYSIENEYRYFKTSQAEWALHGRDGYR